MELGLGWIGQVGGWAGMVSLTALLWWALATGRLLTRSQHESITALHQERYDTIKKTLDVTIAQNASLIEANRAAKEFFEKVPVTHREAQADSAISNPTGQTGRKEERS